MHSLKLRETRKALKFQMNTDFKNRELKLHVKEGRKLGAVVCVCNPSTQEAEQEEQNRSLRPAWVM
jgi:hypothetical protein